MGRKIKRLTAVIASVAMLMSMLPMSLAEEAAEAAPAVDQVTEAHEDRLVEEPTKAPTEEPTKAPTEEPTEEPTKEPVEDTTKAPVEAPAEEPAEAPQEAKTVHFSSGYIAVEKGTVLWKDTAKTEAAGSFTGRSYAYAELKKKASDPEKDWICVYFDLPDREGGFVTGYIQMKNARALDDTESDALTASLSKDAGTRLMSGKVQVPCADFKAAEASEPVDEAGITEELPRYSDAGFVRGLNKGTNSAMTLALGDTVGFYAGDGLTAKSWKSSSKCVSLDKTDPQEIVAKGVSLGTSTITVTFTNGKTGTVKVTVVDPKKVSGVIVGGVEQNVMYMGVSPEDNDTMRLTPIVMPESAANYTVSFKSSNTAVIKADPDGLITAVGDGSATITVTVKQGKTTKTASVKMTVIDEHKLTGASMNVGKMATLKLGPTVDRNETLQPVVSLLPEDTTARITWTSSSSKVATVSPDGLITAKGAGTATITMTAQRGSVKKTQSVKITVTDPHKPSAVKLTQTGTQYLCLDRTLQLEPYVLPVTAAADKYTYKSSSAKILKISEEGIVTPLKEGQATVTVTAIRGTAKKTVTVKIQVVDPAKPAGVRIESPSDKVYLHSTVQLSPVLVPYEDDYSPVSAISWKSSSTKIAKVSANGAVTPVKEGTVTITATTSNKKTASVKLTVVDPTKATGLRIEPAGTVEVCVGGELQLNKVLIPDTATNTVTWKTSSAAIATISKDGMVKGIKQGTVTVTATTSNGKKATIKVNVVTVHVCTEEIDPGVEATCTEPGLTEGSHCSGCGRIITEQLEIPAKGHSVVSDAAVEATCTEYGRTEGSHCSECGTVIVAWEYIRIKDHTPETVPSVEATCSETGLTEGSRCSVCGEVLKKQETVPTIPHTEEIDAAVEATCSETGLTEGSHCSACGEILKKQETVPTTAHTVVTDAAVKATCTTSGLTEGSHCSVCGSVIAKQQTISAYGHKEIRLYPKSETCTEDGNTAGSYCERCGYHIREWEVKKAPGHQPVTDKAIAGSCTKDGLTEGSHCWVCNEVITEQTVIKAPGHTVVTDAAVEETCTESGLTEGSHCSVCNEIMKAQETIPAKGHTVAIDPAVEATCTENGKTEGSHCSVCGLIIKAQNDVPAKGHTVESIPGYAPTFYETGLTDGERCSVCGETITEQQTIPVKDSSAYYVSITPSEVLTGAEYTVSGKLPEGTQTLTYAGTDFFDLFGGSSVGYGTDGTFEIRGTAPLTAAEYSIFFTAADADGNRILSFDPVVMTIKANGDYPDAEPVRSALTARNGRVHIVYDLNCNPDVRSPKCFLEDGTELGVTPTVKCADKQVIFDLNGIYSGSYYLEVEFGEPGYNYVKYRLPFEIPEYMYTVSNGTVEITRYLGNAAKVEVPSQIEGYPVISIGEYAFSDSSGSNYNKTIRELVLPEGIKSIGLCAFGYSTVEKVTFPSTLKTISKNAFRKCAKLKSAAMPSGMTTVGDYAFCDCFEMTSFSFGGSESSIGNGVLGNCFALKSIVWPGTVSEVSTSALSNCDSLETVVISSGVTNIQTDAFSGCTKLTSVSLPSGVEYILDRAFSHCEILESIVLPDTVKCIYSGAFANCHKLKTINIPASLDQSVMLQCSGGVFRYTAIESAVIPGTVKNIDYLFYECDTLKSVTLQEGIKAIGKCTFASCDNLRHVSIPDSLTDITAINSTAFKNDKNLTIHGSEGSAAQTYADQNGYAFSTDPIN